MLDVKNVLDEHPEVYEVSKYRSNPIIRMLGGHGIRSDNGFLQSNAKKI